MPLEHAVEQPASPKGEGPMHAAASRPTMERLPSTLLIAGATAASYWLAHVYESAYLGFFGVPSSFVHVSTNTILVAGGAILSVMWGAFTMASLISNWFSGVLGDTTAAFLWALILFRGFAAAIISFKDWRGWAIHLGAAAVLLVLIYLGNRLVRRWVAAGKIPPPQPQADIGGEAAIPPWLIVPSVARALAPWIGKEGLVIMWVMFLAQGVAHDAGAARAQGETEFLMLNRAEPFVVLRAYDDLLIAAPLERRNNSVGRELVLVSPAKDGSVELRREAVGVLHRD
jgi:hypothetical protein